MSEEPVGRSWPAHILDGFIAEEEFARQRGVSVRTCQRDRARRNAPPYVVIGRRTFYRVEAARAWLVGREVGSPLKHDGKRAR